MDKEKLVTLACVLGILACGACFLPPPRPNHPPPPPPPPQPALHGIATILVDVSNQSESRHLNSSDLAVAVARDIRLLGYSPHITALDKGAVDPDARLAVLIRNETLIRQQGPVRWFISVEALSTLTARDGRVLWSESRVFSSHRQFPENEPDQVWHHIQIQNWLADNLAYRLMHGSD